MMAKKIYYYLLFIAATSLLFLWQRHLYPYVNVDGVTYIQAAGAYLQGGFKAAVSVGSQAEMPFLSILIATVSKISHLSLVTTAYLLNDFFVCLSGVLFLSILQNISQGICRQKTIVLLGALIWLDWHAYSSWWPLIMRDPGAMSFLLLSVFCLLKFYAGAGYLANTKWAVLWALSLLVGALFRFELGIFLALVPFALCLISPGSKVERLISFLKLNSVLILFCLIGLVLFLTNIISAEKLQGLRFHYIFKSAVDYFVIAHHFFVEKKIEFSQQLSSGLQAYASFLLIVKLAYKFFKIIFNTLDPIGVLAIFAWFIVRKQKPALNNRAVIMSYFVIAILVPLAFYYQNLFLNARYVLDLALFALLALTPSLAYIIEHRKNNQNKKIGAKQWLCYALVLVLIYNFVASIHRFGHVSNYEHAAGVWIKKNFPDKTIFSNDKIALFYASSPPKYSNGKVEVIPPDKLIKYFSKHDKWLQYDLLVLAGSAQQVQEAYQYLLNQGKVGDVLQTFVAEYGGGNVLVTAIKS